MLPHALLDMPIQSNAIQPHILHKVYNGWVLCKLSKDLINLFLLLQSVRSGLLECIIFIVFLFFFLPNFCNFSIMQPELNLITFLINWLVVWSKNVRKIMKNVWSMLLRPRVRSSKVFVPQPKDIKRAICNNWFLLEFIHKQKCGDTISPE